MDVLSIVSNVQQVPPEELAASQEQTESSTRFGLLLLWVTGYVDRLRKLLPGGILVIAQKFQLIVY